MPAKQKPPTDEPGRPRTQIRLTSLDCLAEAAESLRVLAHPQRLRIVQMLQQGNFTVGELARACGVASHVASEHLRLMKRCGLLASEQDGRRRFYRIESPAIGPILACIESKFGCVRTEDLDVEP